jgi:hypothetical protein
MIGSPPSQEQPNSSRHHRRAEILIGAWLVLTSMVCFGPNLYADGFHRGIQDILRGRSLGVPALALGVCLLVSMAWTAWRQPATPGSHPTDAQRQTTATAQADDGLDQT